LDEYDHAEFAMGPMGEKAGKREKQVSMTTLQTTNNPRKMTTDRPLISAYLHKSN
jgi:hypothetical protein